MVLASSSVASLGLGEATVGRLGAALEQATGNFLPDPSAVTAMAMATDDPAVPGNIVGVGVGVKIVDGERRLPSIFVLVRRKVGPAALPDDRVIPPEINGFPTSVVETGNIVAHHTRRRRPVPCGVSIGNCRAHMAGTLGCFVREDGSDARTFVLSNNHVLALVNTSTPGTGIPQPGLLDGGACPADDIARLTRFVPVSFTAANIVDAAIAEVLSGMPVQRGVLRSAGRIEMFQGPHRQVALGANVQKSGRTTGHTRGTVNVVGVTVNVNMGTVANPLVARFDQQFQVVGRGMVFSQPGDSGSLVTLDDGNQPVGLLFAGGNGITFCNEIGNVLQALNVSILY